MSSDEQFAPRQPERIITRRRPWAIVALHGDVDFVNSPATLTAVLGAGEGSDVGVVVDLAAVSFIDLAGVRTLLRARESLRADGGDLLLRRPSRLLIRMLTMCGAKDIVEAPPLRPWSRLHNATVPETAARLSTWRC
jgi:anti-anti-sigma factor